MSIAGLERMAIGSVDKRLTLSRHTSRQVEVKKSSPTKMIDYSLMVKWLEL